MPRLLQSVSLLLAGAVAVSSSPVQTSDVAVNGSCASLSQRKAWHTLTDVEKQTYIDAELCLMSIPSTNELLPASVTLFDALQETHADQASLIHGVGAFLPYHRYLMWAHESLLRSECGYNGTQPYWYEQQDVGHVINSTILDPVLGFGGAGRASDGCITDGPFANYTNSIGPGHNYTKHCINRAINETESLLSTQANIDACYEFNTYLDVNPCLFDNPHTGGHRAIGGEMADGIASPGDPIFYLHHTWLDKVWWDWQVLNISSRLYDISGTNIGDPNFGELGPLDPVKRSLDDFNPMPHFLTKRDGDPGNETTLNHVLNMYGVIPNATIKQVMDIRNTMMCYEYVDPV